MRTIEKCIRNDAEKELKESFDKHVMYDKYESSRINKTDLIKMFNDKYKDARSITLRSLLLFIRDLYVKVNIDDRTDKDIYYFYQNIKKTNKE